MKITSIRGRNAQRKIDLARHLEEKYLIETQPLSKDEKDHVHRVFEDLRRQLDSMGRT